MESITIEWILLYTLLGLCLSAIIGVSGYLKMIAKLLNEISQNITLADIEKELKEISSSVYELKNDLYEIKHEIVKSKVPPDDWIS